MDGSQQPHQPALSRRPSLASAPAAPHGHSDAHPSSASPEAIALQQAQHELAQLRAMLAQSNAEGQRIQAQLQSLQQQPPPQQPSPGAAGAASSPTPQTAAPPSQEAQQQLAYLHALTLGSTGFNPLTPFTGDGDSAGLKALAWVQAAELAFKSHTLATGYALTDAQKQAHALRALGGNAQTWYVSLTAEPQGWPAFREAFLRRWQMAASGEVLERRLVALSRSVAALRRPLSNDGLHRFAAQFLQLANQIPSGDLTDHSKATLFIEALPSALQDYAISRKQDYRRNAADGSHIPLHQLVDLVLQRSTNRSLASAIGHTSAAGHAPTGGPTSPDAMDLSALAAQLGVPAAEAAGFLEGLPEWDTDADTIASPAAAAGPASAPAPGGPSLAQQLNALTQQLNALTQNRRNVPGGALKSIPNDLIQARKKAGLCARCGIAKYEPAPHGHNARSCKARPDAQTSVADGLQRAGLASTQLFQ